MAKNRIIWDPKALGNAVAAALKRRKVRQEEIEIQRGVNQAQISRIVNGEVKRFTAKVAIVCEYAKVNAEPFLAPTSAQASRIERLARAAASGSAEREAVIGKILGLLEKLR
jgi:transcriptional regulator with XRE-family HTH domain